MDSQSYNNDNKWVEERIAKLSPPPGWKPDTDKAFETVAGRSTPAALRPVVRLSMAGATLAVIGVVIVLLPWKALWTPKSESTGATHQAAKLEQSTPATSASGTTNGQANEARKQLSEEFQQKATTATPETKAAPPQQAPDIRLQTQVPLRRKKEPRVIIAEVEPQKDTVPAFAQGQEQAVPAGVTQPVVIFQVQPQYTAEAKQARIRGTVIVSVTVREDGTVKVERVVQSLGFGLDEASTAAVEQWKFIPGKKDGQPVAVTVSISMHFGLK